MKIFVLIVCRIIYSLQTTCDSQEIESNSETTFKYLSTSDLILRNHEPLVSYNITESNSLYLICKKIEEQTSNFSRILQSTEVSIISREDDLPSTEAISTCGPYTDEFRLVELLQLLTLTVSSQLPVCCYNTVHNSTISCSYNADILIYRLFFSPITRTPLLENCTTSLSVHLLEESVITNNMSFYVNESQENCLYPDADSFLLFTCLPIKRKDCHKDCYRKCCPVGYLFSYSEGKCVESSSERIWLPNKSLWKGAESAWNETFYYEIGFPICTNRFFAVDVVAENNVNLYTFMPNSSLYLYKYNLSYSAPKYCMDLFWKNGVLSTEALICFPEETAQSKEDRCDYIHAKVYPSFLIVSCLFLLMTIFVYLTIPELNTKLNGKCVIATTSTIMLSYVCLISNEYARPIPISVCPILGLFLQYFGLASFFWTNIMCFDVWRALRSYRFIGSTNSSANRRFAKYCLYAFGLPLLISAVTACFHYIPNEAAREYFVTPGFGVTGCFLNLNDHRVWWAYFYGFILVIMTVNLFLFVHLLLMLHRDRTNADAALHRRKQKHVVWLKLYSKLFFLMGVTWIFEIISWVDGNCRTWIWIDSINALRGFFIFVIFVCKRSIWRKLKDNSSIMSSFKSSSSNKSSTSLSRSRFYVDIKTETPKAT